MIGMTCWERLEGRVNVACPACGFEFHVDHFEPGRPDPCPVCSEHAQEERIRWLVGALDKAGVCSRCGPGAREVTGGDCADCRAIDESGCGVRGSGGENDG